MSGYADVPSAAAIAAAIVDYRTFEGVAYFAGLLAAHGMLPLDPTNLVLGDGEDLVTLNNVVPINASVGNAISQVNVRSKLAIETMDCGFSNSAINAWNTTVGTITSPVSSAWIVGARFPNDVVLERSVVAKRAGTGFGIEGDVRETDQSMRIQAGAPVGITDIPVVRETGGQVSAALASLGTWRMYAIVVNFATDTMQLHTARESSAPVPVPANITNTTTTFSLGLNLKGAVPGAQYAMFGIFDGSQVEAYNVAKGPTWNDLLQVLSIDMFWSGVFSTVDQTSERVTIEEANTSTRRHLGSARAGTMGSEMSMGGTQNKIVSVVAPATINVPTFPGTVVISDRFAASIFNNPADKLITGLGPGGDIFRFQKEAWGRRSLVFLLEFEIQTAGKFNYAMLIESGLDLVGGMPPLFTVLSYATSTSSGTQVRFLPTENLVLSPFFYNLEARALIDSLVGNGASSMDILLIEGIDNGSNSTIEQYL